MALVPPERQYAEENASCPLGREAFSYTETSVVLGVIPRQNFLIIRTLLRHKLRAGLAHAHAVPIAERRKRIRAVFIRHRKTRAA